MSPPLVAGFITCPGGTPITDEDGVITGCEEDGRYHIRGQQALWSVYGGNELLDGDMILVLNANMDGPPKFDDNTGVAFGSFELIPDGYPDGSWVGTYNSHYEYDEYEERSVVESRFVGHGTGELEGLKMKSYDLFIYTGVRCGPKSRPFTVEIHDPKGEFF